MKIVAIALLGLLSTVHCRPPQGSFPALKGPYLGQKTPGLTPEIFLPGLISTGSSERSLVFAPEMDELFYQLTGPGFTTLILTMKVQNGQWNRPAVAFFSGVPRFGDDCPFITPDGKRMFFASERPLPGSDMPQSAPDLWVLSKDKNGWGQPEPLGPDVNSPAEDYYPTVSRANNIYFGSNRDGNNDIYLSTYSGSGSSKPIRLGPPINTEHYEGHPFIAADESYLIFSSDRPGELGNLDLYISFKGPDNGWSEPVNLGPRVNSADHEAAPYVSPDGRYLFFCSFRSDRQSYLNKKFNYDEIKAFLNGPGNGSGDIYWVSVKIFEELKPGAGVPAAIPRSGCTS